MSLKEILERKQRDTKLEEQRLEKELTELRGWKYNPRIPYAVKQMTDEEFKAAIQKAIDDGFPDLTPCCKREYRNGNGECINCFSHCR